MERRSLDPFIERLKSKDLDPILQRYFHSIIEEVLSQYEIANKLRSSGPDHVPRVETELIWDMAERVEKLIGLKGVADFIRSNKGLSRERLAIKAVDKLIDGEFGDYELGKIVDLGVRLSLAILTEGMTVAPLDGIRKVVIKKGTFGNYLSIYYAGPIRSAGGTETGLSIVIADYLRQRLGLERYYPTKMEIHRFIEELRLYERNVARFQYHLTDEMLFYILSNLPVEVTGVPTDNVEVLVYRDIPSIETNRVRGGALRVVNDGVGGKAKKLLKIIDELGIDGWEWLEEVAKGVSGSGKDDEEEDKVLNDLVMGRPVISLRTSTHGLRLRLGRLPNTGISAVAVHPAVFSVLQYFIVPGSQLKLNLPGKGGIVVPSRVAMPPIVELDNGDVVELDTEELGEELLSKIKKILFLGDIIISYGDFLENNQAIPPLHYTPEWWLNELEAASDTSYDSLFPYRITYEESVQLSEKYGIPLNPYYVPSFEYLDVAETERLVSMLSEGYVRHDEGILVVKGSRELSHLLKKARIPFSRVGEYVEIRHRYSYILRDLVRGYRSQSLYKPRFANPSDVVSFYLGIKVRCLRGTYISARLGRPEKAKMRKMNPPVHALFPVGSYGGDQRNIVKAYKENEVVVVQLSVLYCENCGKYTYRNRCETCGSRTIQAYYCHNCRSESRTENCPKCGKEARPYKNWSINLRELIRDLREKYGLRIPSKVKGVKSLLSGYRRYEELSKGVLRAKHGLSVFKDGTCRIDITNAPLTSVSLKDIGLDVERARELGYEVSSPDDVIDLMPMDIIIPESIVPDLINICRFIDEEIVKLYGGDPIYKVKEKDDLIGKLVVGLSPHTSSGIVGRIIGFTKANVLYAHPLWHAAKRRDCDGDQDAIMLLMDVLLNFSREYLPSSSGGRMDAPLFISMIIHPEEVDTQVHNLDIVDRYPLILYEKSLENVSPKLLRDHIAVVEDFLGSSRAYYGYGALERRPILSAIKNVNMYSKLSSIEAKLDSQLKIMEKIFEGHDKALIVENLLKNHVLRDIMGNLRSFYHQSFKCSSCGATYRRVLLKGTCIKCGRNLRPTVHTKGVVKYLPLAKKLSSYVRSRYILSYISLIESVLASTFELDTPVGTSIFDYVERGVTQQDKTDQ